MRNGINRIKSDRKIKNTSFNCNWHIVVAKNVIWMNKKGKI